MQVVVTSLSGHSCTISAKDSWTVNDLKTVVRDCMNIHVVEQRLIYGTAFLEGPEAVSSLGAQVENEDQVLYLTLVRLDQGAAEWLRKLSLSRHYNTFREAPESIRNDRDMVFAAVCAAPLVLLYAEKYWYDTQIVMTAIEKDSSIFQKLPEETRGNREIAKAAICSDGRNLQFAEKFHSDLELVSIAVSTHASALWLCPQELWNPELVLHAVHSVKKSNRRSLADSFFQRPELKALFAEKEFMLVAIDTDPMLLQHALEGLKIDREIVRRAVEKDWHALDHAADELKSDREIVCMALAQSPLALQFAGRRLQDDSELVRETVSRDSSALKFASRRLQRDEVITAVALCSHMATQSLCF